MRLKDKVSIITGGGSGLGEAGCRKFASEGAIVVVADFNEDAAKTVAQSIVENGGQAVGLKVNVADRESVDRLIEEVIEQFGRIDVLINNAGITMDKTLLKMTQEQWQGVLDVNLTGVFNCGQAAAIQMAKQGSGKIVNTSSIVGIMGNVGQTNYAAAKAGLIGMTKSWAKELGRKGINVNAVAPGFIATPMTKKMPEEVLEGMRKSVALQRLGSPEDIANAYLFLSSSEADYINGAVLSIDGGLAI